MKNMPKGLPQQYDEMSYYIELLPEYIDKKKDKKPDKKEKKSNDDFAFSKDSKKISAAQAESNLQEASNAQWQKLQDMFGGSKQAG